MWLINYHPKLLYLYKAAGTISVFVYRTVLFDNIYTHLLIKLLSRINKYVLEYCRG